MLLNIHTLDLNFLNMPHAIASYLIEGSEGPVLVESGPSSTLDTLKTRLAEHGLTPGDIHHVLLTHIHLDHAGAAGWWASRGAHIYVHHVGAPHLIDPSKLVNSAKRIYGEMMDYLWGEVLPVPADQITALNDGDTVTANGLTFTALDTPGHARHHHTYRLGDIAFTGDAAGIRLPGRSLVFLPSPPPEFDREAWRATIDRLQAENFRTIYPTHFGSVENPREHFETLKDLLEQSADFVGDRMKTGIERDVIVKEYSAWNRGRADALDISDDDYLQYESTNPQFMSVDGLMRYWKKKWEA
jgi:glyoxylase-like metal-dependent hydrolase (beta-lactamase superfamily II)